MNEEKFAPKTSWKHGRVFVVSLHHEPETLKRLKVLCGGKRNSWSRLSKGRVGNEKFVKLRDIRYPRVFYPPHFLWMPIRI